MSSLGTALPEEIKRVSELRDEYLALPGGVGSMAALMMKVSIDNAVKVQSTGDVVGMIQAYEDLKGFTELWTR